MVKNIPARAEDTGSIPGLGRFHKPGGDWACVATTTEAWTPRLCSAIREATTVRSPCNAAREYTLLVTIRESLHAAPKTQHSQKCMQ